MPCRFVSDPNNGKPYSIDAADDMLEDESIVGVGTPTVDPPNELAIGAVEFGGTLINFVPSGGVPSKRYRVTIPVQFSEGDWDYTLIFDCRQT